MAQPSPVYKLAYAGPLAKPDRRALHRRLLRGTLLLLLATATVAAIGVSYRWPWVWYGSTEGYRRHQLLRFNIPAAKVVFEMNDAKAQALLLSRGDYGDVGPQGHHYALHRPALYWEEVGPEGGDSPGLHCGIAFLHERTGLSGLPRLTIVRIDDYYVDSKHVLRLSGCSFAAGAPAHIYDRGPKPAGVQIAIRPEQEARVFGGQPDPADASRFTIKYEIDHQSGTIEGRIQPDDTVRLQVHDGPGY